MNEREQARAARLAVSVQALRDAAMRRERNRKARASGRAEAVFTSEETKWLTQHARMVLRWGSSAQRALCLPWLPPDERARAVLAHRRTVRRKPDPQGADAQIAALAQTVATAVGDEIAASLHHGLAEANLTHLLPADAEGQERLRLLLLDATASLRPLLVTATLAHTRRALEE